MANPNINAGAKGNPLDTLLAGRNIYGSTGFSIEDALAQSYSGNTGVRQQLGQFGTFGTAYDDSNTFNPTSKDINQSGRILIDGKQFAQLKSTNIGGPGEAVDPSKVTWNDKYGLITDPTNIKSPADLGGWIGPTIIALGTAAMGAYAGGLIGGAGEAAASSGGAVGSGLSGAGTLDSAITGAEVGSASEGASLYGAGADAAAANGSLMADLGGASTEVSGGSSLLGNLNTARKGYSLVENLGKLLGGGKQPPRTGGGMGDTGGVLGGLMSLLGLGGLARQGGLVGNGVGTPGGAQAVGDRASAMADPWGTSGLRGQAQQALTPGVMMSGLGLNPDGTRSDITKDPGYKFALEQGTNAINIGDAAQGTLRSGNRGAELAKFGTGLAAQYEGQFRGENLSSLGALSNMAGLSSSSPTAAAESQIGAFAGATSLQNSGLNGLLGTLLNGSGPGGVGSLLSSLGGGLTSLLSQGGGAISSFFSTLFGDSSGADPNSASVMADILGGASGGSDVGDIAGWAI